MVKSCCQSGNAFTLQTPAKNWEKALPNLIFKSNGSSGSGGYKREKEKCEEYGRQGGKVSLHYRQPSCFCSPCHSYKQAGEESLLCPLYSQRTPVKAGRSVVQISCFSIWVLLDSYRLTSCNRYLDSGNGSAEVVQKPGCFCQICFKLSALHICEVF